MNSEFRDFEEKICFLEQQVDELKEHQAEQQKTLYKMEKKVELLENTIKQLVKKAKESEDDLTY